MTFQAGQAVVRRYLRGDYVTWAQAARVIADDESGLLLWVPEGAGFACRESADGERLREVPIEEYGRSELVLDAWRHTSCLILIRPGTRHSLWWVFRERDFHGWYVNLEEPVRRWMAGPIAGVDTVDHGLDVVIGPQKGWRWKDEEEFEAFTGQPGYWSAADANAIRTEAQGVLCELETGAFPFDGTWCDFRPEADWDPDPLPESGWQEPLH